VDQDLYSLLRYMCERRFRAHQVVLRNFNFLNMCEQCLEAELNEVYSHAWLLVFMMALLLLYNRIIYQVRSRTAAFGGRRNEEWVAYAMPVGAGAWVRGSGRGNGAGARVQCVGGNTG
jgi:hypothetical protein